LWAAIVAKVLGSLSVLSPEEVQGGTYKGIGTNSGMSGSDDKVPSLRLAKSRIASGCGG